MYPRPLMEREDWTSLDGTWKFFYDDERKYVHPTDITEWPMQIVVPFPPESKASGIGDRGLHQGCWYERRFQMRPGPGRVLLHFGAVDYIARVWINGHLVAFHEGGHTPFSAEITPVLNASGEQTITVMVEDDPAELTKPRGKQDWQLEPHSIWYPRTTGIWQTVWLERVNETYISKIRWTPRFDGFAISFEARIKGRQTEDLQVDVTVRHGNRILARDSYQVIDQEVNRRVFLADPGIDDFRNELLWSPERPTLLDAEIRLKSAGVVIDTLRSYTALRDVSISRDRFLLNGRPYLLRMVLDQGYW
ncbi:MAG TPA: glycoside hydrolase family 2, partial [Burkholderiales bacterium]|nr:glycoside hydrolase family 2 [Burkholderiales bacterium]